MCDRYEEIEHTADIAIRVHAQTFQALLHQAGLGMLHLMGIETDSGEWNETLTAVFSYVAREDILVQALNEVLYQLETTGIAYLPAEVVLREQEVEVTYRGCSTEADFSEIKAVTYHQMEIIEEFQGLHCMVVFDV